MRAKKMTRPASTRWTKPIFSIFFAFRPILGRAIRSPLSIKRRWRIARNGAPCLSLIRQRTGAKTKILPPLTPRRGCPILGYQVRRRAMPRCISRGCGGRSAARWADRYLCALRHHRRRHGPHRCQSRRVESARRPRRGHQRRSGFAGQSQRRRKRHAQSAGHQLLASLSRVGRVVWGARTLRGADQLADE